MPVIVVTGQGVTVYRRRRRRRLRQETGHRRRRRQRRGAGGRLVGHAPEDHDGGEVDAGAADEAGGAAAAAAGPGGRGGVGPRDEGQDARRRCGAADYLRQQVGSVRLFLRECVQARWGVFAASGIYASLLPRFFVVIFFTVGGRGGVGRT